MALQSELRGPFDKFVEVAKIFAGRQPSPRTLLANRRQRFDRLHAIAPSDAVVGEPVSVTLQAWDQCERLLEGFKGGFRVGSTDPDADHPDGVHFDGQRLLELSGVRFGTPGIQYLTFSSPGSDERYVSNPVRVGETPPDTRTYWGDIHLHSRLSDGAGSIAEGMRFGRDVMDLDVVAYTDHDTMDFVMPPRFQRRRMHRRYFDRMKEVTASFHDPGSFVTLLAYEWTQRPNVGGHVNVYFDSVEEAALFDSMDPDTDTYEKLWARLREWNDAGDARAVTIPHHPAEAMYPFDFTNVEYDDELAPLVEVYSRWGSSERPAGAGNHRPIEMGQGEADEPGHYVQDALRLGNRVGLAGSSDYHGPHPGHSLIHTPPHFPSLGELWDGGIGYSTVWRIWNEQSYPGGLQAFRAPELTREAVFGALERRRVYATTQPHRILVWFAVDDVAFGEEDSTVVLDAPDAAREIAVEVAGTAPLEAVTVVKNNEPWRTIEGVADPSAPIDTYTAEEGWTDDVPVTGMSWADHPAVDSDAGTDDRGSDADVYYVRVQQADGGGAWAGPVWVEPPGE